MRVASAAALKPTTSAPPLLSKRLRENPAASRAAKASGVSLISNQPRNHESTKKNILVSCLRVFVAAPGSSPLSDCAGRVLLDRLHHPHVREAAAQHPGHRLPDCGV